MEWERNTVQFVQDWRDRFMCTGRGIIFYIPSPSTLVPLHFLTNNECSTTTPLIPHLFPSSNHLFERQLRLFISVFAYMLMFLCFWRYIVSERFITLLVAFMFIHLSWFLSQINKRGDSVEDKIKKLDAELARYKEQIKKTRPGPAQDAVKARAMRILKQKRM